MNSRVFLYSAIAGIIVILVFFFIGKSYGRNVAPKPVDLPPDTGGTGGNAGAQLPEAQIQRLVDDLKEDIYSWGTRNSEPYVQLLALSNTDYVRAYNDWNSRYYKLDKETLRQAIEGEVLSATSFTFANIKPQLINRFISLGLA